MMNETADSSAPQAGILALSLEEGVPCPVCGSRVHPAPASLAEAHVTEEELEQAKGQRDLADQRLRIHMEQVQTLRAQTEAESEQCKTLYLEMREASGEQVPVCLETALEEMKAFYVLAVQDEQRQREEERQYQEGGPPV